IANYCRKMEQQYQLKKVLSPRKYLSKEQRQLPRLDQRKERMRQNIKQALHKSKSFHEFEQRLKEKGYQLTKARGISFTDEKKVEKKEEEIIAFVKPENEIDMESETPMFEIAFNNMAEEFKEVRQQQVETNKALSVLGEKMESFGQKLTNLKITPPPVDTGPV